MAYATGDVVVVKITGEKIVVLNHDVALDLYTVLRPKTSGNDIVEYLEEEYPAALFETLPEHANRQYEDHKLKVDIQSKLYAYEQTLNDAAEAKPQAAEVPSYH